MLFKFRNKVDIFGKNDMWAAYDHRGIFRSQMSSLYRKTRNMQLKIRDKFDMFQTRLTEPKMVALDEFL